MGINFKEVAYLRGDDNKFKENFNKIDWSAHNSDNHIVNKLTEETIAQAQEIKQAIDNENSISLMDGDFIISHNTLGDSIFTITDKRSNKTHTIDPVGFTMLSEEMSLILDAFSLMYFEILHRDHIEELENQS